MVTKKNHPIYQNNGKTSPENRDVEPVEPVHMNIYQSSTYRRLNLATFQLCAEDSNEAANLHTHFCGLSNNSQLQIGAPAPI